MPLEEIDESKLVDMLNYSRDAVEFLSERDWETFSADRIIFGCR